MGSRGKKKLKINSVSVYNQPGLATAQEAEAYDPDKIDASFHISHISHCHRVSSITLKYFF